MRSVVTHKTMCGSSCWFYTLLLSAVCLALGSANAAGKHDEPVIESKGVEIIRSDDGTVTARIRVATLLQYPNGDQVCPDGAHAEFSDPDKAGSAVRLSARRACYDAASDSYELQGDVKIESCQEDQQLRKEALSLGRNHEEACTDQHPNSN